MSWTRTVGLDERRVGERSPVRFPAEVVIGGTTVRGHVVNISATGALIAVPCDVTLGTEISLTLELPDDEPPVSVDALAIRKSGQSPVQVGLTFILPPQDAIARIRALIYDDANPLL